MEDGDVRRRNRWLGSALAVATAIALLVLFLPILRCPSCDGAGKHLWNGRDYPCLVCDGVRRVSGQAWIRAMAR